MKNKCKKKIRLTVIIVIFAILAVAAMHKYNVFGLNHNSKPAQCVGFSCSGH